jgi:8-oxo-dGTP pyrophosphatase MutT (NUDIX family)
MKRKIIAAGGLVTNEQNELLMIFRRGKWDLPKGKLDKGESIERCAVREVEEETGITDIILGALINITYHDYFDTWSKGDVTKETHWYAMSIKGNQTLIPQTEEDITDIQWINDTTLSKCLSNSYPTIIDIIDKWKNL